jgi:hypothetical protein
MIFQLQDEGGDHIGLIDVPTDHGIAGFSCDMLIEKAIRIFKEEYDEPPTEVDEIIQILDTKLGVKAQRVFLEDIIIVR